MSMKLKKLVRTIAGDDTSQAVKIAALESAVGSKDTDAGSLKKRCADIEADVGASDSAGIKKRCKDLEDAIGDADTSGTILYRLYQLEHPPANNSGTE